MPQIQIAGQVHMIRWEGKRVSIWERFMLPNGKEASRLWTAWFDIPVDLQEEDWAEVHGELSTKIGEYTPKDQTVPKQVVEHHIQNAVLVQRKTKAQQEQFAAQFEDSPF